MKVRIATVMILFFLSLGGLCPLSFGQQPDRQQATPSGPSRPKPDSSGRYRVGNGVKPPKITHSVNPEFTKEASRKKLNGTCVLSLTVGVDGMPHDISVVRSIAEGQPDKLRSVAQGLDAKAVEAVEQYSFEPATLDGEPVPVVIRVEIRFNIF